MTTSHYRDLTKTQKAKVAEAVAAGRMTQHGIAIDLRLYVYPGSNEQTHLTVMPNGPAVQLKGEDRAMDWMRLVWEGLRERATEAPEAYK